MGLISCPQYLRVIPDMLALLPVLVGRAAEPLSPGAPPAPEVLFRNVRAFDGKSAAVSGSTTVLLCGNTIAAIGAGAIQARPAVTVIDGGGRTLVPGLIDARTHTRIQRRIAGAP